MRHRETPCVYKAIRDLLGTKKCLTPNFSLDSEFDTMDNVDMARGRTTRTLRRDQIAALQQLRTENRYSYAQLKLCLGCPCNAETLHRAIDGQPIWDVTHAYIAQFCERHLRVPEIPGALPDFKKAAAHDKENGSDQEPREAGTASEVEPAEPALAAEDTQTHRGSR